MNRDEVLADLALRETAGTVPEWHGVYGIPAHLVGQDTEPADESYEDEGLESALNDGEA